MASHAAFQQTTAAQPPPPLAAAPHRPLFAPPKTLAVFCSSPRRAATYRRSLLTSCRPSIARHRRVLSIRGSAAPTPIPDAVEPERWLPSIPDSCPPSCSSYSSSAMPTPVMKGGQYGSLGSVTLEKSKLDLSQKTTRTSPETAIGGGGGDIGKKNFHGGGDGGDDGGDDDDYFDDFDEDGEEEGGGLFRRRLVLQELFDRKFVDAVLQEWYKTVMNLPAGLRQAYELGLVSSAQMVRYLSINARPTVTRAVSRSLPQWLSRAFIGRMLADPSFLSKLMLEEVTTGVYTLWWEFKNRKERIKQEWDLALINVLTVMACNAIVVTSLAPSRSYGSTFRFDLQNTIQKLPNNIFEKSYRMREFDLQKRIYSFFYKAAEFSLVGLVAGSIQGSLSNIFAAKKQERLSVSIPSISSSALGYGAFLGLYANVRYQLLCGIDRAMFDRFDVIGVALFFSTALRIINVQLGETSRLAWLGIEADPLLQFENFFEAYNRPAGDLDKSSSKWFISKNAIVSGLGLLGIKQGNEEADSQPAKTRRKRIVRRKVSTS